MHNSQLTTVIIEAFSNLNLQGTLLSEVCYDNELFSIAKFLRSIPTILSTNLSNKLFVNRL